MQNSKYPKVDFELWIYKPNPEKEGYLKYVGMATYSWFQTCLDKWLKSVPSKQDPQYSIADHLDYFSFQTSGPYEHKEQEYRRPMPDQLHRMYVWGTPGSNEGYYFHIDIVHGPNYKKETIFLAKTLSTDFDTVFEILEALNYFIFNIK